VVYVSFKGQEESILRPGDLGHKAGATSTSV
jgi:hypothetical protein